MDYYKQKRILRNDIRDFLINHQENNTVPSQDDIRNFVTSKAMNTGFAPKTVRKEFELFGMMIVDDRLVKVKR